MLDRVTDTVLGAPRPGSDVWSQARGARDTAAGRAELAHRARVKVAITRAAGMDPRPELERARRVGIVAGEPTAEPSEKTKTASPAG